MEQAPINLEKHRTRDEDDADVGHANSDATNCDDLRSSIEKAEDSYTTSSGSDTPLAKPLAGRKKPYEGSSAGPITEALAHHLRIRRRRVADLDDVATQDSVFDGDLAEHYKPNNAWENIGHFDPSFRWTWREERAAMRKVDFKIFAWVLVMFFALNMTRSNVTNATADNDFFRELGMKQADYNAGLTIYRVGFLLAELPSQIISKRLGPDVWIPIQIVAFSVISASQFWLSGRASFLAIRALLAIFMGGIIPDAILYLSYWYTRHDLSIRLAMFFCMNFLASTVTSFVSAGTIEMSGLAGKAGFRWMFLIQGLFTLLIGIASFWLVPPSPSQTSKGYLSSRDAKIIVNRVIRDDPGKASMHNREGLTLRGIWDAACDWHLYPMYLISLLFNLPTVPVNAYLQLSFRQLGFTRIQANLLAAPNSFASMITILLITVLSEAVNNRSFVCMLQSVWLLPCFIALVSTAFTRWSQWAIATVLLSYPWVHAIQVSWTSRNSGSVRTRTVSAALYNMSIQMSSIIGANVYQASDSPRYLKANKGLIAVIAFNIVVLYPGTWLFYRYHNRKREAIWSKMSGDEKADYLRTTRDTGNKRLDFRFDT